MDAYTFAIIYITAYVHYRISLSTKLDTNFKMLLQVFI
jgi:hypothetical protein